MTQNLAQTFYVDAQKVKGSPQVDIGSVELFFKRKPPSGLDFNPNVSGIQQPGVTVFLCGLNTIGQPNIDAPLESGRLEYDQIPISGDASAAAKFIFDSEVYCETNKEYAIVVVFDGYEDFELWTNAKGRFVVGTTNISSGTNDKYVGNLFTFQPGSYTATSSYDPSAAGSAGINSGSSITASGSWVAKTDEDLKFNVYVCRYFDTGTAIPSSNTITSSNTGGGADVTNVLVLDPYEYILFDRRLSQKEQKVKIGEYIYQNTSFSTGTVKVQAGNLELVGTGVNFSTMYGTTANNDKYIVLVSVGDDPGHVSGNLDKINIRKIVSFNSNTSITIDRYPTISNTVCQFLLPTPVGRVTIMDRSRSFNKRGNSPSWYYKDRFKQDFLILQDSNANSSVRFVNNAVETITITSPGATYNNTDVLTISSSTSGSLNCTASITTNSTGAITTVYISNTGYGMLAQPTATIANSTGGATSGSGATFTFTEGPTLRGEYTKLNIRDTEVINWELTTVTPAVFPNSPAGTRFAHNIYFSYFKDAANSYIVNQASNANKKLVKNLKKNDLLYANTPLLLSRSNEAARANTTTVTLTNGTSFSTTSTSIFEVVAGSTSDFICPNVPNPELVSEKYLINNDFTNEHTPFGNADAKHISAKLSFQDGRTAEDVMVYLRAYRPANTDLKVFARVHNAKDPQAFDDKDWSLLDCISGNTTFSSTTNKADLVELTYTFPASPNTYFQSPGVITTVSGNTTVNGVGTRFTDGVFGFSAGDLVKIYPPLFPSNYQISTVNSVANATQLVLTNAVTNASMVGTGFAIDKLYYKNQAFNNIQNGNVVTYYNTSMHGYSGYDTFAIKIVMLSTSDTIVPEVDDIRAIGVSA